MKIYLSAKGFLVIEDGTSYKSLQHDKGSPFRVEKVGSSIIVRQLGERVAGPVAYNAVFLSDGATPAGASVSAVATYIEGLLLTAES